MSRSVTAFIVGMLLGALLPASASHAADDVTLHAAFQQMREPELDTGTARIITGGVLQGKDLTLHLDSGMMVFFKPVAIDADSVVYGGIFEGKGRMQYAPPIPIEQNQLRRFFDSDSLDRSFERIQFWCTGATMARLVDSLTAKRIQGAAVDASWHRSFMRFLTDDELLFYVDGALRNLAHPRRQPYLLANAQLSGRSHVIYLYDPYRREEVNLLRHYDQLGYGHWLESVCSYPSSADGSLERVNGIAKEQIRTTHYDITAAINRGGNLTAEAVMTFDVAMAATQQLYLTLMHELKIDSIMDSAGHSLAFLRHEKDDHKLSEFVLFLPRVPDQGEQLRLRFFYQGEIAKKNLGEFYIETGADWYPRYGFRQRATFDMHFATPVDYGFVATGRLVESTKEKQVLLTHYRQEQPTSNVAFNIGTFKQYDFAEDGQPPIAVHFSESLHDELAKALAADLVRTGSHMERQVAGDVRNSLKLYSALFGPYPHERMVVSEILAMHSEAFPAFLHLGYSTWINTDPWGYDRLLRSHEVAHQWWGAGVGYETYHDQWLSEGFAEYSAFMFLQATAGNDKFLDRLDEYRKEILRANSYLFGEDVESGPIILGRRTASSKTRNDYGLIIYEKGAFVLHMLRQLLLDLQTMKEDRFMGLMRDFFAAYAGREATTLDFKRMVEQHTGVDMTWFFDQWVMKSAIPTYDCSYTFVPRTDSAAALVLKIAQKNVPADFRMYVPVEIEMENGAKSYLRLLIDEPAKEFSIPIDQKPKKVRFNPFQSVLADVNQ